MTKVLATLSKHPRVTRAQLVKEIGNLERRLHAAESIAIERKSAEAALKASEAQAVAARDLLENAIESLSEGFVYFDAQERLVLCNRRYAMCFMPGIS